MDDKTQKELQRASALFYAGRLAETYQILRRFYDRLPFRQEIEHAHHIGIFARTLLELGKEWELKFYSSELEKLYRTIKSPELGYQLASVLCLGPSKKLKEAKELLGEILKSSCDSLLIAKTKLFLAYCYDHLDNDLSSCRKILSSIEPTGDEVTDFLAEVWKAKILRDEKKYEEAEPKLLGLISKFTLETNWYCKFTAQNVLAILYIRTGRSDEARGLIFELKKVFSTRKFNTVSIALNALERELDKERTLGSLEFSEKQGTLFLSYANRSYEISKTSSAEKLLISLARKKFLDRSTIVKILFNRLYDEQRDNKTVYYHIHSLRKLLSKFGIPAEAVSLEGNGYRLIPDVRFVEA